MQQEELYSLSNWPDSRDRARERAPLPLSLCTLRFVTVVTEIKIPSVEYQKLSKVPSVNSGVIIIIIYPLTARIAGTLQMISQPVFFFFSVHFSLFPTALWDLPNSSPVHSLMLSSGGIRELWCRLEYSFFSGFVCCQGRLYSQAK